MKQSAHKTRHKQNSKRLRAKLPLITSRRQVRSKSTQTPNSASPNQDDYDEYGSQSFLLKDFPTTSTKFQRKERDPVSGKVLKPGPPEVSPTTWDFRSLFDGSFIEIETKTKTQARTATSKDEDGNVIDDLERLSSYPEGQLRQIALGLGEFKPKVAIDAKIQARNLSKLLDTKLQLGQRQSSDFDEEPKTAKGGKTGKKSTSKSPSNSNGKLQGHGTTVLELGDDENAWNSLKNFGNAGHLYSGFLDPIELPTHITSPPLVNLLAARVLASKLHAKVQRSIAQDIHDNLETDQNDTKARNVQPVQSSGSRLSSMQEHQRIAEDAAAREQSLAWFAKASWAGDVDSSLQMAQIFDEVLSTRFGLSNAEPTITIPSPEQITSENRHIATAWQRHPKLQHLHPGPVFQLTPTLFDQIESTYSALTDALMPRLHGKQLQGIDYRSHHPIVTALYYYETFVLQSQEQDALSVYCEWLFGLDELFAQVVAKPEVKTIMEQIVSGQRIISKSGIKWDQQGQHKKSSLDEEDQDGDVFFVSNYFSGESTQPVQDLPEPNSIDIDSDQTNSVSSFSPVSSPAEGSGYFPKSDSFIGSYLQAYLKPLTLHPIHGMAAQLLLDSFQESGGSAPRM